MLLFVEVLCKREWRYDYMAPRDHSQPMLDQVLSFTKCVLYSLYMEMDVEAGGILQGRPFVPRASSSTAGDFSEAVASTLAVPAVDPADEQGVEDIYGPSCFDEDSSTIGSGFDKEEEDDDWGSIADLDEGDDDLGDGGVGRRRP